MRVLAALSLVLAACLTSAYYQRGDMSFEEFELPQATGECSGDADCVVSGCQRERCTARAGGGDSPCDLGARPDGDCGCVESVCAWHN
jgi:hypothetical protein